MSIRTAIATVFASFLCAVGPALAQLPPPPPPPVTLWSFLGIPQAYRSFRDNAFNKRGNRPGLERKPPLKAIADPANLKSPNPAIKKAAEIKQEEDLAPQKIKAVKFLAQIGCGCYNRDGSITDALIKSMDDCTEAVRLATVWAISEAANGEFCENCKQRSCCSEEITKKLYEIAYERDENGCYLEPSERVRAAAAEALRICCPGGPDFIIQEQPLVQPPRGEVPGEAPPPRGEAPGAAPPPLPVPTAPMPPVPTPAPPPAPPAAVREPGSANMHSSRRTAAVRVTPPSALVATAPAGSGAANFVGLPTQRNAAMPAQAAALKRQPTIPGPNVPTPAAAQAPIRETLAPIVSPADLKRLPPTGEPSIDDLEPSAPEQASISAAQPCEVVVWGQDAPATSDPASQTAPPSTSHVVQTSSQSQTPAEAQVSSRRRAVMAAQAMKGTVTSVMVSEGLAHIELDAQSILPPGSLVRAYHEHALSTRHSICDLEVVLSEPGMAVAKPRAGSRLADLAVGDHAVVVR